MIEHNGMLKGNGKRFGIVVSRFNDFITDALLKGARDCLLRHGASDDDIEVVRVPGAWEIPTALGWLGETGRFDALIALGAVIRGATPHFDLVANGVSSGVAAVSARLGLPVGFGVITTETIEQAIERAGTKAGNKGWDAAMAALEMANLADEIGGSGEGERA